MKCGNLIIKRQVKRKGNGELFIKIIDYMIPIWRSVFEERKLSLKETETAEICDGNIKIEISAEEEAVWGGSCAVVGISYSCDKCNKSFMAPHLPSTISELNSFVQKALDNEDLEEALLEYDKTRRY